MARLHPNAREMIDRLHGGEPYTLVLDEAHHLAATWGELLAEVLRQAHGGRSDGPVVVALTATPRDSLSAEQAALVDELFGPVLYSVSTPALVRDGVLAPYREFAWFVDPTPGEREYLTRGAQRWRELVAAVMAPDFADVGLLTYLDSAWVRHEGVSWSHIQRSRPELARALVRASFNGLIAVPQGARVLDEHRQPLQVEDWVAILSEYGRTVLAAPDPPAPGWEQLRAGLRSVGWTLTRNGARRGQSSVDRVLSRSASKALAAGYLVEQEYLVRGDDLRAVVLHRFRERLCHTAGRHEIGDGAAGGFGMGGAGRSASGQPGFDGRAGDRRLRGRDPGEPLRGSAARAAARGSRGRPGSHRGRLGAARLGAAYH